MSAPRRQRATQAELESALRDLDRAPRRIAACDWPADVGGLGFAGLYSWWTDSAGADAIGSGLGVRITAGRIYAGQTGATRWPSGQVGRATLGSRISGNHLGSNVRSSTFRRTLASALLSPLELELVAPGRLSPASERQLTRWIRAHLEVAVHPFADRDALGDLERRVLAELDPPLNLEGMSVTSTRAALSRLRAVLAAGPATVPTAPDEELHVAAELETSVAHGRDAPTLHEEMLAILRARGGSWITASELAEAVNARAVYAKADGTSVTRFQIARRAHNYPHLFEQDGSRIRPWRAR